VNFEGDTYTRMMAVLNLEANGESLQQGIRLTGPRSHCTKLSSDRVAIYADVVFFGLLIIPNV
jgi:hypothetical protein